MASVEILNATQANVEAPVEIQLSLSNPIYRGPEGRPGKDGVIGRDGKSAYEIAVEQGFEGTEAEWIASLGSIGPKGDTPIKGVDYFTEQDIQDIAAQVPQPDLSNYKKVIHLSSGTVLSTEDKQFLQNFADPYISLFENNEITQFTKINICDIDLYIDDYLMSYFYINHNNVQGYSLWFYSPIELIGNQWLLYHYYYYFSNTKITEGSRVPCADDLQIKNSNYRVYNNGTSVGLNFGYIKDNYATKSYVEDIVRGIETGALKRAVVEELPTEEIDENTIYMVAKTGSIGDVYDEYLYVNSNWEHIGSTDVDLTGYRKTYSFPANTPLTQEQIDILAECYTLVEGNYDTVIRDLPFELYIENLPVWGIRSSGDKYLSFYTWTVSVGTFGTDMTFPATEYYYTFNKTLNGAYPTQLTRNTSSMRADGLVITHGNTLNGNSEQQIGNAFSYIKNNYVKTTDMPAYLTNSDILAIWNGENN